MGIGLAIDALRQKLIEDINGAGLPPVIVELVMQPVMAELHEMAMGQMQAEKNAAEKETKDAGTEAKSGTEPE